LIPLSYCPFTSIQLLLCELNEGVAILHLLLILFCLSLTFATQAEDLKKPAPQNWTFSSYLKEFLEQDENYRRAQLDYKIASAQYSVASDLFQNTLSLQPTYLKTKTLYSDGVTPDVEQSRKSIQGGFRQLFPTGTEINFQGTHFLDDVDPFLGGVNKEYNGFIEQSLWRDAFGYGSRSRRNSAEQGAESAKQAEEKALLVSCINAAEKEKYVKMLFKIQKKRSILQNVVTTSVFYEKLITCRLALILCRCKQVN
jgi:hypothetical protein